MYIILIYINNYLTIHNICVTLRTYLLTMDNIIYKSSYRYMEKDRGLPLNWVMYTIKNFIEGYIISIHEYIYIYILIR